MDNKRRLQIASAANPSLRVAAAPPQQLPSISIAQPTVQPKLTVATAPVNQPRLVDQNGNEIQADPNARTQAPTVVKQKQSLLSRVANIGKNIAVGIVKAPLQFSEDYSNTFGNLGNKLAGGQNQTIQQNMGGDPVLDKTLQFSGATGKNKQLATSFGETALNFAPGAEGFGIGKNIIEQGGKQLLMQGGRAAAEGAALGAASSGLQQVDEGKFNGKQLLEGAGTGALFGLGGAGLGAGVKAISNKVHVNDNTVHIDPDVMNYLQHEKDPTVVHDVLSSIAGGTSPQLQAAAQTIANTGSKKAIVNALLDLPQEAAAGTVGTVLVRDALHGGENATERELQQAQAQAQNAQGQQIAGAADPNAISLEPTVELDMGNIANGSVPDGTPGSTPAPVDTSSTIPARDNESVAHLTGQGQDKGVYARLTPEQQAYLTNETGNIPFTTGDQPHLSAKTETFDSTGRQEVSLDDLRKQSPNLDAALTKMESDQANAVPDATADTTPAVNAPATEADLQALSSQLDGTTAPADTATAANPAAPDAQAATADSSAVTTGNTAPVDATSAISPIVQDTQQAHVSQQAAFTPEERAAILDSGETPDTLAKGAGFAQSVRESENVSENVQGRVAAAYNPITNVDLQDNAAALLDSGVENAQNEVAAALNKPDGSITAQDTANAIALAKHYDNLGGDANWDTSGQIYDRLAAHLTAAGQTIQAASLLDNLSPEGLAFRARTTLQRAGADVSEEANARLNQALEAVRNTPPGTEGHTYAVQAFRKAVADQLPATLGDKATALWKAGLLTGLRTQTGNILSNGTFAILHELSNPGAVLLDKLASTITGDRTKALTGRGQLGGLFDGVKKAGAYVKTGIDERQELTNKFESGEINFKNPVINTYVNGIFRIMGAADRPFYYRQLANSMYDLAKADGLTKGLSGDALKAHVNDFVQNADNDTFNKAFNTATEEAQKSVLANDTFLGKLATKVNKAADEVDNPLGRAVLKAAVNVAIPFSKVPSAFITRVFDFTPYGAVKEAAKQASAGALNQRALVTAISEATTGTALVYLGSKLADGNLLSGQYPDDPREQARWKAEGITPNSVKVGDKWVSLNYFGPVGSLFSMGKRVTDTRKEGGSASDIASAVTGGTVQDALGQSFLQGVSGILDAVNDPKRYAKSFVNSEVGSIIPTISNDIATATDDKQRQTNSPVDAITNRIPVLRNNNLAAVDSLGNTLTARTDPGDALANPFRPSDAHSTALTNEIDRLHYIDPNNSDYQVTPEAIDKTLKAAGGTTKLSPQQRTELQTSAGHSAQLAMTGVMNSDAYKAASDDQKAKMLKDASSDAIAVAKDDYEQKNSLGQYAANYSGKKTNLTQAQKQIAQGNLDGYVTSVANKQAGLDDTTAKLDDNSKAYYTRVNGMSSQDLQKYLASPADDNAKAITDIVNKQLPNGLSVNASNGVAKLYADYQKAKATGNWTKIEAQQKLDTFNASVVKANKSSLTQDLYDAGGTHAQTYLNEGYVDKSDLDDAIDLDNQLYSAGLEGSMKFSKKFRNTYGYGLPAEPKGDTSKSSASSSASTKAAKEVSTHPEGIKLHFEPGSAAGTSSIGDAKVTISAPSQSGNSGAGLVVGGVDTNRTSDAAASFARRGSNSKPQAIKIR